MFLHVMHGYILTIHCMKHYKHYINILEDLFGVHLLLLVLAGLHDAADYAEGQRSRKISKILHWNPGHDVSPQPDPRPLRANAMSNCYSSVIRRKFAHMEANDGT